ncbi:hypothetical protein AB4133_19235 [Vibrio sp. 10N.286.52.F8]|uniref:hypothetical protein n=1 Tax=Vibrio sp. 10N.286.52.F8 TaxID=3229716 RepID=UPI00354BF1A6
MKKVTLLAAAVALGLTGCGSDSPHTSNTPGNDGTPPGGDSGDKSSSIVVKGFDGYFHNAVVFADVDDNGKLNLDIDTVFGLTDENGELTLPKNTEVKHSLGLQTLRPGDVTPELAQKLSTLPDNTKSLDKLLDLYTRDMDLPDQPMSNAVVLRTPKVDGSEGVVISPITDLVAIEMRKNNSTLEAAASAVSSNLGGTEEAPIDLFSDFVEDSKSNLQSARLHKTAQILTESKAKNPSEYEKQIEVITDTATEKSEEIVTEDNMGDENLVNDRPIIDPTEPETAIRNFKLLVNPSAASAIQKQIHTLKITETDTVLETIEVPNNLFEDKYSVDGALTPVRPRVKIDGEGEITAELDETGTTLTLSSSGSLENPQRSYTITFEAEDKDTQDEDAKVTSTLRTTFSFDVDLLNTPPSIVDTEETRIQTEIVSTWNLIQGAQFTGEIPVDTLFEDREDSHLTYTTNIDSAVPGLKSEYDSVSGVIHITGYPKKVNSNKVNFTIHADDGHTSTFLASAPANFTAPPIQAGSISINEELEADIQAQITTQWSLTVGKDFEEAFSVANLFSSKVSGDIEYYAHYAPHDNETPSNPIPGVSVNVDSSGLVTLSGRPTSETNNVVLYIAQGINFSGGEENDIESEMVTFRLPNVQPGDVTPPTTSIEDQYLYQSALENYNDEGTGLACEVRYFDSETQTLYAYTRTQESFTSCPEINTSSSPTNNNNFESLGSYTIDASGGYVLNINDGDESFTIRYSAQKYQDYFVFQNTETFDYLIDDKVESMTFEEMYPAYTTPQQLNASISQRITDGVTDDVWVEGTLHYIDQNGNINDMDVDAAMNDVDDNCTDTNMCESGVSDADIYLKMSCEEVKANYTFDVYSMSGTPFSWEVQYFDSAKNNSCGIDFTSITPITSGIRTIHGEVKEEKLGKFADILFSFAR